MSPKSKTLFIDKSTIPGAGKGLFTREAIKKGTRIIEYKGKIRTWKEVSEGTVFNGYVFYISDDRVIDGKTYKKSLARYANDAKGLTKQKDIVNNTEYTTEDGKVYVDAIKNIPAGGEILVAYGKDYWDVIKENMKLEEKEKKNS